MDQYCHFHPSSPAKWRCNKCMRLYDNVCVPTANEKQQQGMCQLCEVPLRYLPTEALYHSGDVYPLKTLLKDCFTPTHFYSLCISLCLAITLHFFGLSPALSIFIGIAAVFFINLHFARVAIYYAHSQQSFRKQSVRKRPKTKTKQNAPLSSVLSVSTSIQLSLISLLLLLFPVYCFYSLNWLIGLLLIVLAGATLPFLVIFSFYSSYNEHNITLSKLFNELKPFYFKLASQSISLYWLVLIITDVTFSEAHFSVAISISMLLSTTVLFIILNVSTKMFTLSLAKLSGQQATLSTSDGPPSIYQQEKRSTLDTDIDQGLKTGQYQKVVALLEEALKRNSRSSLRRQQLFLLLSELNDTQKLARYAELFLHWMLERNKIKDASQFIYQLRKNDPAFVLHDILLMTQLAKQFFRTKKYALVFWLSEDAKARFKPSEELAELYLVAAQALITHFKDLNKAEEYLLFILRFCAEYPSVEPAKALLIHLQNNQKKQQDLRR